MWNIRRVVVTGGLALLLSVGIFATAMAGGRQDHKVALCHQAAHKFVQISVAQAAMDAHMAHGDVSVDEYGGCP